MASVDVQLAGTTRQQQGLMALVLCGGNSTRAAELCAVPERTLRRWRVEHGQEYERVRSELAPRLESMVVGELRGLVIDATETERLALHKLHAALEADLIPERELAAALRNVTVSKAVNIDKLLSMSGRPTSIVEHRSLGQLVARLAAIGAVVDGSAEELPAGS